MTDAQEAEAPQAHVHEETRAAVEAAGHDVHGGALGAGGPGDHGDHDGGGHEAEHWGGNGTDPLPTYAPLGPIDWRAWGAAAVAVVIAVVTAALFWLAAYGR